VWDGAGGRDPEHRATPFVHEQEVVGRIGEHDVGADRLALVAGPPSYSGASCLLVLVELAAAGQSFELAVGLGEVREVARRVGRDVRPQQPTEERADCAVSEATPTEFDVK